MPSIWQFISRHKVILESDQVRINDLKQFVAQWDSVSEESHHETSLDNGEEVRNVITFLKIYSTDGFIH